MEIKQREKQTDVVQAFFQHQYPNANVTVGYVTIPVGERLPKEGTTAHHEQEYSYVLKGSLKGESGKEPYEINAGEFSYIPAGEPHWCVNEGQEAVELVYAMVETK